MVQVKVMKKVIITVKTKKDKIIKKLKKGLT